MTATLDGEAATRDIPKISKRRLALLWAVGKAGRVYVLAREWRVHLAAPGVAGAGLISSGVALKFGVWAGLIVAGAFCLRLDSRMR